MIRIAVLLCLIAVPLRAETVAEQAMKASADLQAAVAALECYEFNSYSGILD